MTAYRLLNNVFEYKEAFVDFKAMRRQYNGLKVWFNEENESLRDGLKTSWQPVDVTFEASRDATRKAKLPDLSVWNMSCLVLSEKAKSTLSPLLLKHGEIFPLNQGFHLFNCLESIGNDAVDGEQSAFEIEQVSQNNTQLLGIPKKLALHSEKIEHKAIFKPGFSNNSFLICQDEFKNLVEKTALGGLIFEQNLAHMFPVRNE